MQKIKRRIFEIVSVADEGDIFSKIFDFFIIGLIMVNLIVIVAETCYSSGTARLIYRAVEIISVIIFTIEYLLRIWTADLLHPEYTSIKARIRYMFSMIALIDAFAILPFYLPFIIPVDLRILRVLRMMRLLRLFKVNRYTKAIVYIGEIFKSKANQLLSSMVVVILLMVISSVIMYEFENSAQPNSFRNAFSGLWWAVATFTTVGYGDIYPVTMMGKILSSIMALMGIGLVAVPTGIISAGFIERFEEDKQSQKEKYYCPYCGNRIED